MSTTRRVPERGMARTGSRCVHETTTDGEGPVLLERHLERLIARGGNTDEAEYKNGEDAHGATMDGQERLVVMYE